MPPELGKEVPALEACISRLSSILSRSHDMIGDVENGLHRMIDLRQPESGNENSAKRQEPIGAIERLSVLIDRADHLETRISETLRHISSII